MNHEQALEAASRVCFRSTWTAAEVVRAYLSARAEAPPSAEGKPLIWRRGSQITVGELLADFGEER